jgi:hypothetical protein
MLTPILEKFSTVLDPIDRNAEILFGLFMCLTFTGTISVATAGREGILAMELAAIGCNAAWGLVDAVMYLMRSLVVRGHLLSLARAVRSASDPAHAHAIIAADLRPLYLESLGEEGVQRIYAKLLSLTEVPAHPRLQRDDYYAALLIFALVFLSTFPLVLPFMIFDHLPRAMRWSAGIAIILIYMCGYSWGKHAGVRPVRAGLLLVVTAALLETAVILLGG